MNRLHTATNQNSNGFKQTDIGLIPEDWDVYEFESTLADNDFSRNNLIPSSEFKNEGKYPIIDQGQEYIAGYTDIEEKVYKVKEPVVLFGDHTRIFKYIDFPFVGGADGIKIFTPNLKFYNPKFFYYALTHLKIPSRGYNRHYKLLKEKKIMRPPLPEQKKIAHVLSKIQQAIEVQEKIIKTTQELKKALMQKLFTEGLNGEPQKQTEIGPIPESWEVVELGSLFKLSSGKRRPEDISELPDGEKNVPIYGGNGILGYTEFKMLDKPVLVIGRVGEYCGVTYVTDGISWISDNALYTKSIIREFNIYYMREFLTYFNLNRFRNRGGQPLVTQGIIHGIKIGLPKIKEQKLISSYLESLNAKIQQEKVILESYKDLFQSSLQQLMTGKIRVKDIESKLEETAEAVEDV